MNVLKVPVHNFYLALLYCQFNNVTCSVVLALKTISLIQMLPAQMYDKLFCRYVGDDVNATVMNFLNQHFLYSFKKQISSCALPSIDLSKYHTTIEKWKTKTDEKQQH